MRIQYLGTAAAEGWPAVFCHCLFCEEARRRGGRDIRTRSQALIEEDLLIDFPPDSYLHSLQQGIDLSAAKYLLLTHSHMDHMFPQELVLRGGCYAHKMVSPDLHIFGSSCTKAAFDRFSEPELEQEIAKHLHWHILEPFEPVKAGDYQVTALPANHMPSGQALNYLIQKDGKTLLYWHDTGWPFESVFDYLVRAGIHPDLVSMDCTSGPQEEGPQGGHMGIPDNRKVKDRLEAEGICSGQTVYVINHFSHNGGLLYDELCEMVRKDGFLVSFDGRIVDY